MDALTVDGDLVPVPLSKEELGIERAEIEGQAPRLIAEPSLLQDIAVLHRRRMPEQPAYAVIYLRNSSTQVSSRNQTVSTLATWQVRNPQAPLPSKVPRGKP